MHNMREADGNMGGVGPCGQSGALQRWRAEGRRIKSQQSDVVLAGS
jgi:hypothetical protein